jgi:hypothetical protein
MQPGGRLEVRRALAVGLVGLLVAAALVASLVDGANPRSGEGREPFVTIYAGHRDQVEALLVSGDGQAFAAIAQDPTLARPELVPGEGEFAYRAQRPLWGYLAWSASLGHGELAGWVLALLTVLAAGACVAVVAGLLLQRGLSPWWALAVLAAGLESISQLTPELLALALFGGALLLPCARRPAAIALCCAAVLTRETMLVAVGAWALHDLVAARGAWEPRVRRVASFSIPFVVFAGWVVVLRLRVGTWTWHQPHDRAGLPFDGLRDAFNPVSGQLTIGVGVAILLCGVCLWTARSDVLTWIAVAYAVFATTFAGQVWTGAGYQRTLLPLYVLGGVAALDGLARRSATSGSPRPTVTRRSGPVDQASHPGGSGPGSIRYSDAPRSTSAR